MKEEKIVIRLHALDWIMGEFAFFDVSLFDEGVLYVDWGDGLNSNHITRYKGEKLRIEHDYGKKAKIAEEHFIVTIYIKDTSIKYLHTGCIDIAIDGIDFNSSPSIESLNMCSLGCIDLSPIVNLEHLVCQGSIAATLDLRGNINLKFLDCRFSKVQHLLLSKCDKLQEIDCSYCHDLRTITLSNNSCLSKITISSDNKLKSKSWKYVKKIIEKNNGEIKIIQM